MILARRICVLEKDYYYYRKNSAASACEKRIRFSTWPIDVFFAAQTLLQKIRKTTPYLNLCAERYFSKAISGFGKCDPQIKKIYFGKLKAMASRLRAEDIGGWWHYVRFGKNDGYFRLKCSVILAKCQKRIQRLFSIRNQGVYKYVTLFGICRRFKRREKFSRKKPIEPCLAASAAR